MTHPYLPTATLSGSAPDALLACALTAIDAVFVALDAVKATAPNGRDYIGRPAALLAADAAWAARVETLRDMLGMLETDADHYSAQLPTR